MECVSGYALEMDLGLPRQDSVFRQLSVYATYRPGNFKDGYRSVSDLLRGWGRQVDTEEVDVKEEEVQTDLSECRDHELKVKGFELDSRIVPGFRYHVRNLGTEDYLWEKEARRLESIGLGYGRRLTFKGDTLNFNDCFFWTDSSPNGFAFTINAIKEGDEFSIIDADHQHIGTAIVQDTEFPQIEEETIVKGTAIVKTVKVRFSCFVKHNNLNLGAGSLINVNAQDFEMVEGIAELVKERGSKEAVVRCIKNVYFQSYGKCNLHSES